jgi:hypothetical protein
MAATVNDLPRRLSARRQPSERTLAGRAALGEKRKAWNGNVRPIATFVCVDSGGRFVRAPASAEPGSILAALIILRVILVT